MKIGIIGAGQIGGTLTATCRARARGPETLRDLASETGAKPVIKVFNNIYVKHLLELGRSAGTPGRIALPVSGDDAAAKPRKPRKRAQRKDQIKAAAN